MRSTGLRPSTKPWPAKPRKPMKSCRSTGKPTKAEAARMDAIKEGGCVIAWSLGMQDVPCEVHHLTVGSRHGQKRRGHLYTVGLNPWSHRGVPFNGMDAVRCQILFGPSYAREPKRFRDEWPDDRLLSLQAKRLGKSE